MISPAPTPPSLPLTAKALEEADMAAQRAMASIAQDARDSADLLAAEAKAGRAVVCAFAAETAGMNNQENVLKFMRWSSQGDRMFIRRMVNQWRTSRGL